VRTGWAEVRAKLARGDAPRESSNPAAAQRSAGTSAAKFAIEEDGHRKLMADPVGEDERLGTGRATRGLLDVDDGRNIERSDMGMLATPPIALRHHVDPRDRLRATPQQGACKLTRRSSEREHRAMMISIGVDIQKPGLAVSH
jgi:hypothetical protein